MALETVENSSNICNIGNEEADGIHKFPGCHIDVEGPNVFVTIPIPGTSEKNKYVFAKREVKRLMESLYASS